MIRCTNNTHLMQFPRGIRHGNIKRSLFREKLSRATLVPPNGLMQRQEYNTVPWSLIVNARQNRLRDPRELQVLQADITSLPGGRTIATERGLGNF